jgi:hypothetical protein
MNIFFLDKNLKKCAKYHMDKHVVKMILEYAQILCSVLVRYGHEAPYKQTHKNHPCVLWCGESKENWETLQKLCKRLNDEYVFRYEKDCNHKSYDAIKDLKAPDNMPSLGITSPRLAMPKEYQTDDPIESYRSYYRNDKKELSKWKKRDKPYWY